MLDLRDLAERFDELNEKRTSDEFDHMDQINLMLLNQLQRQLGSSIRESSDEDPILVPESEWVESCRDYADSSGLINNDNPLMKYIDWKSWAYDMSHDYTTIEYDGVTYYRSA